MDEGLIGQAAIVTGAGGGIGLAICSALRGCGMSILAVDRDASSAVRLGEALGAGTWKLIVGDVSAETLWEEVFAEAANSADRTSVLVNNAGLIRVGKLEETSLADWREHIAVNLDSVFLGTRAAIRHMKAGGGAIINIASVAAMVGIHTAAPYCAAKGGVRAFTKAAALYCARQGYPIRVNSIHPGYIESPMTDRLIAEARDRDAARDAFAAAHPVGRLGTPEDIAAGVAYLAGNSGRFVTGSELVIDGGYLAQ